MGKKLDALLGRSFKATKLKSLLNLAISRLNILKNQRQVRYSQAKSDITQLLLLGHHHSALLRVDHLISDLNMFDVFLIIHGYCSLLLDRLHIIQQHRDCPDELREAISSLFFAASRIGDFPELQEIRTLLASRYGREFASRSIELRSNCAVNSKMVQKLSTRQPALDIRMKVLTEIAEENNIVLKLDEASSSTERRTAYSDSEARITMDETVEDYGLSDSIRTDKKYKDVADAAQAAFESAAYAAAAARAAVVLSQSDSRGPDDHFDNNQRKRSFQGLEDNEPESEQEGEVINVSQTEGPSQTDVKAVSKRLMSDLSTDSEDVIVEVDAMSFTEDPVKLLEKDLAIYDSEEETQHRTEVTKEKDDEHLMGGKKRVDIGHVQHLVHSINDPTTPREGPKVPVSVRTRQVRGY